MNHWVLGDFEFNADTRSLRGPSGEMTLEPKSAALLAYFCEHPNRNIDRDELIESVWRGRIVSENAINRVIVLLRKALQDDDKVRRYIATVPTLGYRMIADVAPLQEPEEPNRVAQEVAFLPDATPNRSRFLLIACAALALITFFLLTKKSPEEIGEQQRVSIVPLSRLAPAQSNADLAELSHSLLYTAASGAWNAIYQVSEEGAEPLLISEPGGNADYATWAHGDEFVVYRFSNAERCEFHLIERDAVGERSAQRIYTCVPGSPAEFALSPDNATLYFVERGNPVAPYVAYALDLERSTKRRLSQPVARGYGNHYVDVHPGTGKLLILADETPGKTSVYELDTATDSFTLRRAFDYGLDSALWSHRDGFVVHPSRHPSYQLIETSLDTGASTVLVSDSRRISGPKRIDGGYLFTSYLYNRDIDVDGLSGAVLNSAVMDYLPAISNAGDVLAFVSKRSGDSQIWIRSLSDGGQRAVEPPDIGRRFLDLQWSADDKHLVANTNSGILVYSVTQGSFTHDVRLALPAYAVQWHDVETLSFSHYEDQRWRAYLYRLGSGEIEALDERWAFSLRNAQQQLYFDQALTAHRDGRPLDALKACAHSLWRSQLRLQLDGQRVYCHAADAPRDLLRFDADMEVTRLRDVVSRYEFFSVRDGRFATTRVASAYSDIMRTRHE